jgi:hypothetical protein
MGTTVDADSLVDLDTSIAPEAPPLAVSKGPSLRHVLMGVLRHPSRTFQELAEHPGRSWLFPLLATMVLTTTLAIVTLFSPGAKAYQAVAGQAAMASAGMEQLSDEERAQALAFTSTSNPLVMTMGIVTAVIGGIVGTVLALLIITALFHLMGTLLGGQQSFGQMFTVIAWAGLPIVLGLLLKLVAALFGNFDPSPAGLSGLVAPPPGQPPSLLAPFLGHVELWNLWTLALFVPAVQAAARIPRKKALAAVGVYLLLNLAVGLAGTFLVRALVGMRSG